MAEQKGTAAYIMLGHYPGTIDCKGEGRGELHFICFLLFKMRTIFDGMCSDVLKTLSKN